MSSSVLHWRVRREFLLLKAAGAAVAAVLTVLNLWDARGVLLAGGTTVMLTVLALRDLLVPVRLAADGDGIVVVKGFAGSARVPWSAVERIRVDTRTRFTSRTELLEIETEDALFLLSRFDLGAPVQEVADELRAFRTGS
ncbi:PH domain-containing protein [Planomonospora corallina]|uniref:PH domain-containing protein n=1 Tax=Planomonospora corallina TaxID=1806052 RepID=A0ABV8IIB8_9ACTN